MATVAVAEELGRSTYGGFAVTVLVHTDMATPHLHHAGTEEQKARYMPDLVAGRRIAAVAMTEADAGSDLASMRTTARRDANGWVLDGSKMFITNGIHGDVYFVAAKTGAPGRTTRSRCSSSRRERRASRFAAAEEAWLAVQRHRGAALRRLPAAGRHLLGEENRGF